MFAAEAKRQLEHDRLSIYLLTPDGLALERFAVATSPMVPGEGIVIPIGDAGIASVLQTNDPFVIHDSATDERLGRREDRLISDAGFHGAICAPLRVNGRPFGILNFVSQEVGFYGERDLPVAQQIADHVSVFLHHLRLQEVIRRAVESDAVERERNRLGRELHDTVGRSLEQILVEVTRLVQDAAERGEDIENRLAVLAELSENALGEVRRAVQDMPPRELEHNSFVQAIGEALERMERRSGIATRIVGGLAGSDVSSEVTAAAFRILQEALANVEQHSGASLATVKLSVSDHLHVSVHDNGRGFLPEVPIDSPDCLGLNTMRARARMAGGELTVKSTPGSGTEVSAALPVIARPEQCGSSLAGWVSPTGFVRVVLIDRHPLFRAGVRELLTQQKGLRVVGEAATAAEAVEAVQRLAPDLVLLDLDLPGDPGAGSVGLVREHDLRTIIVAMSDRADADAVADALAHGANGYVGKDESAESLLDAVRSVLHGGAAVNARWMQGSAGDKRLTQRELDVVDRIAAGYTNAEIGEQLFFAPKTVERIVGAVIFKLESRNRTHAAAKAVGRRLIDARRL